MAADVMMPIISTTDKSITYGINDIPIVEIFDDKEIYHNTTNFKEYRRKKIIQNLDI